MSCRFHTISQSRWIDGENHQLLARQIDFCRREAWMSRSRCKAGIENLTRNRKSQQLYYMTVPVGELLQFDSKKGTKMATKQAVVRQAIQILQRHIPSQIGLDQLNYTLRQFDELMSGQSPIDSEDSGKHYVPPYCLEVGESIADKLTPGYIPQKRE